MPGFNLYSSNRMEILAERLSDLLRRDPLPPLEKEVIVVQSRGMQRWLSLELARHLGVCANIWFPFPNAMVHRLFQAVLPELSDENPWDPDVMTWTLVGMVPAWLEKPGFGEVRAYVGDSPHPLKLYQLCQRIASTFDQYLTFRPDMLLGWEKGKEHHWQAALWRGLRSHVASPHGAGLWKAFLERASKGTLGEARFPKRISVFGISTLPPFHIETFGAAALVTDIHLFLMNPCREYWLDIVPERTLARLGDHVDGTGSAREPLHFETGNSLLSSLGILGKEFLALVNRLDPLEHECYQDPETVDLLSWVQHDILTLCERGGNTCERQAKGVISEGDTSIRIHSCHNPLRELEVLKDQLFAFFEEDHALSPGDVLVMTPDIETYAPFVEAVFSDVAHPRGRIPFSIADRAPRGQGRILDSFLWMLDLKENRFTAPEVMDLLECSAVMERFDLSESDLLRIQQWVADAGIRWGISAEHRGELGLPALPQNTWTDGLDRLILGYAMSGGESYGGFHGIIPYDRIEGRDARFLGRLAAFLEALFDHAASLEGDRTLNEWSIFLKQVLVRFFCMDGPDRNQGLFLRRVLERLAALEEGPGFRGKVDVQVIRSWLLRSLAMDARGLGFITGGVTFCAMLPMRSIPFKIICLLGMNSDAYPRRTTRPGFDLLAADPRPGDRSQRNDDRYLFLEAILSARKKLHISYVGQDPQDNSKRVPSVVVSELMDYVQKGFVVPGNEMLDHILIRHRLQPFSPTYFAGTPSFFSYSEENCEAARSFLAPREPHPSFITRGLGPSNFRHETIQLPDLIRFYANPARFLLRHLLHVELASDTLRLEDTEPFFLDGLNRYRLGEGLLKGQISGLDQKALLDAARGSGLLPHGTVGLCAWDKIRAETEAFVRLLAPWIRQPLEPLHLETEAAGVRVIGRIANRFLNGLVQYRFSSIKGRDLLSLWLCHLLYNRCGPDSSEKRSLLFGKEGGVAFEPLPPDEKSLADLVQIFLEGSVRPVPFFPETSLAYARAVIERNTSQEAAMGTARRMWQGDGEYWAGESDESYYRRCFEGQDPLDDEFRELALRVFGPLMGVQRSLSVEPSSIGREGP